MCSCFMCLQIPRGNKQNREWLLRQLKASIHEQFQPVQVTLTVFQVAIVLLVKVRTKGAVVHMCMYVAADTQC